MHLDFVIIGAQKSGSTFLQACLNDHPDIYLPNGETPFFESPDYEQSDIGELERIFEKRSEKCLGIKRPNYIGKPEVPKRIASHLPKAKLIAVLRNPVDRAISAYYHYISNGFIPVVDVEIGLRKLISEPSFSAKYKRSSEVIEFGFYYKYLSKYNQYKQNSQLMVILYDDLLSKPLESVQQAYDFLSVSRAFIPKSLKSRPQKVTYNLMRLKLLSLRSRFIYVYNEDRTRLFVKKMTFKDFVVAGALTIIDGIILSRFLANNKPKVEPELRRILNELYANDIKSLESFIGRDLSAWRLN